MMRTTLLTLLAAIALSGCEPNKQAVPDPAQPPKPRVATPARLAPDAGAERAVINADSGSIFRAAR